MTSSRQFGSAPARSHSKARCSTSWPPLSSTEATRDAIAQDDAKIAAILDQAPRSVSLILGPDGLPVAEARRDEEGILYGEIDVGLCVEPRQFHDLAGYYNRFDVFKLTVDRTPRSPAYFEEHSVEPPKTAPEPSPQTGAPGDASEYK
jgi:nitrilase